MVVDFLLYFILAFKIVDFFTYLFGDDLSTLTLALFWWAYLLYVVDDDFTLEDRLINYLIIPFLITLPLDIIKYFVGNLFYLPVFKVFAANWVSTCLIVYIMYRYFKGRFK